MYTALEFLKAAYSKTSETDVSVVLFQKLREAGFVFKTEVKIPKSVLGNKRGCRFDVVVYKDTTPIAIVEVKRLAESRAKVQEAYYKSVTGLPVFMCKGFNDVDRVVKALSSI